MLPLTSLQKDKIEALLSSMSWEEKVSQLGSQVPISSWEEYVELGPDGRAAKVMATPVNQLVETGQLSVYLRDLPPRLAARKANEIQHYAREHTRVGIPPIIHDEGLHGLLANDGTSFPQAIGMGSSWEPELLQEVATAIGREARSRGIRQLLSPTINISRDPRGGRTEETYGEDPYLAAAMACAFVRGVQSQGVAATPKHYAANFVGDGGRDSNAVHISERLLREIYFPAFEAAIVEAGALSIMAAYNSLDGLPCSCNPWLLKDVLRGEWGFEGIVVSDYDSIIHILVKHQVAADKTETAKRAVEAGMDVELPDIKCFGEAMLQGIRNGSISQEAVNQAVRRVLSVKFRLGLFDDPYVDEDAAEAISHCQAHQELALRMARKSLVLLKNEDQTLPIAKEAHTIAMIGPLADQLPLGGYTWEGYEAGRFQSLLETVRRRAAGQAEVLYAQGCTVSGEIPSGITQAILTASRSKLAVICAGNHLTEGEGRDRSNLSLPGVQAKLIEAVAALGIPTVVVLMNGSAVIMDWADQVGAILEAWYPGEGGAAAITEALFGDLNPGGKLPLTIPYSVGQLPLYYNYKPSGRDTHYFDMTSKPRFPFGHGLSYTTFAYRGLSIEPVSQPEEGWTIRLELENTGSIVGEEVVQLYIHDKVASVARPVMELKGFRRLSLQPGEIQPVVFHLPRRQMGLYDQKLNYVVEPGVFDVMVGSSSADIRLQGLLSVE